MIEPTIEERIRAMIDYCWARLKEHKTGLPKDVIFAIKQEAKRLETLEK